MMRRNRNSGIAREKENNEFSLGHTLKIVVQIRCFSVLYFFIIKTNTRMFEQIQKTSNGYKDVPALVCKFSIVFGTSVRIFAIEKLPLWTSVLVFFLLQSTFTQKRRVQIATPFSSII